MATKVLKPTIKHARKVLEVVDAGLSSGLGSPVAGEMCIEAAVCFAFGLPHGDNPPCVGEAVRAFKIALNDASWSSKKARAEGMRKLAIAQIGSDSIDQLAFSKEVALETIRQIVPMALRAAAKMNPSHKESLEKAASDCEKSVDLSAAYSTDLAAYSAANSARSAAYSAAYSAADSAYLAARSAADSARSAADSAYSAARSADLAADSAYSAADSAEKRDKILRASSEIALKALINAKSPGAKWLHLCDE